ncbi:MAG: DUF2971 domain-containing protein [Acidobacteria bacterium]|nr:DUF2971 domain-containing protein [Acidobacteriota bacterium]
MADQVVDPPDPQGRLTTTTTPTGSQKASLLERLSRLNWGEPPNEVFHYTDWLGLKGIVETGSIWATERTFLNDRSERDHALNIVQRFLRELGEGDENHTFVPTLVVGNYLQGKLFVTSFSEAQDSLGMWRGYGPVGGGFAIGRELRCSSKAILGKVTYSNSLNATTAAELRTRWSEIDHSIPGEAISQVAEWTTELLCFTLLLKHPAFVEEREWRLVVRDPIDGSLVGKLREAGNGRSPKLYVELRPEPIATKIIGLNTCRRLPISSIHIGPTESPAESSVLVEWLLRSHGYDLGEIQIRESEVPYRTT